MKSYWSLSPATRGGECWAGSRWGGEWDFASQGPHSCFISTWGCSHPKNLQEFSFQWRLEQHWGSVWPWSGSHKTSQCPKSRWNTRPHGAGHAEPLRARSDRAGAARSQERPFGTSLGAVTAGTVLHGGNHWYQLKTWLITFTILENIDKSYQTRWEATEQGFGLRNALCRRKQ